MPSIGIGHTKEQIYFFSNRVSSSYLAGKMNLPSLEQMKLDIGLVAPVISLIYGDFGGLVTNNWVSSLWEGILK